MEWGTLCVDRMYTFSIQDVHLSNEFMWTCNSPMNTTLDRIKKGVRADAAAKKLVKSTYRLFFNAAGLSGATLESYLPLNDFHQVSTSQAIVLVEEAMSHLPGHISLGPSSPFRVAKEHNWFSLRSAINRRQRALEHGQQMLVVTHYIGSRSSTHVHHHTRCVLCPHFRIWTPSTY